MSQYGNIDVDEMFDGHPVEDWLNLRARGDLADGTVRIYKQRLLENEADNALDQFLARRDVAILEASVDDLFDYRDYLRAEDFAGREIANRFDDASTFYSAMMDMQQTDANPAGYVSSESDFDDEPPDRDHNTVDEMAGYLQSIADPTLTAAGTTLLKYGIRRGLVLNTDLCCVHIDDPRYLAYLDEQGIELREEIENVPDSMYFYGNFSAGDVVNGEERPNGNKRTHPAVVPIDSELKTALLNHLNIRPNTTGPAHPLFTMIKPRDGKYKRITGSSLYYHLIQKHAFDYGIAAEGGSPEDVDLQYGRHFFGTQMRRARGDHDGFLDYELIKYIRGDKFNPDDDDTTEDVLDTIYTHDDWGVEFREEYEENIYTFDLFD